MARILCIALCCIGVLLGAVDVEAKRNTEPEKILYIPLDNRPIVDDQTIAVVEKAGYEVVVPPKEFLGSRDDLGNPDRLWVWLEKNTTGKIKAAVISSDAMLYGSLIASRKHNYDKQIILERVELFRKYRKAHKKLPIYVFGSVMRTPRSGQSGGYEEPDYYRNYGANIFRYTALKDKFELEGLTPRETKEINFLQRLIPEQAMSDWIERRDKNFEANERLIDLAKDNAFNCLLLGRDDNAPFSQTHMEGRYLSEYGRKIDRHKYQTIAGIDEFGLMLLTRAINDRTKNTPTVFVTYDFGTGGETIPAYSDEPIDKSISDEILAMGATRIDNSNRADFILAVNTNPNGQTYDAMALNDRAEREGIGYVVDAIQGYVDSGRSVAVADVSFANGADNALMEMLKNRGLLFKLHAYAGWNTASNSTGFALGEGILAKKMNAVDKRELLYRRYLDDWGYQANVRNIISENLDWARGDGYYSALNDKRYDAAEQCARLMTLFARHNLGEMKVNKDFRIVFPWNRMFEAEIFSK